METIDKLTDTLDFSDFASQIIHAIVRVLDSSSELRQTAMNTLCCLVVQLGQKYNLFIPMVKKVCYYYFSTSNVNDALILKSLKFGLGTLINQLLLIGDCTIRECRCAIANSNISKSAITKFGISNLRYV